MKKILILLATICCCGCSSVETKATSTTETTKIKYYRNDLAGEEEKDYLLGVAKRLIAHQKATINTASESDYFRMIGL